MYSPSQMGGNSLPSYPMMYNPTGPTPSPASTPMIMGTNAVFMSPYMYNMNTQGSCSFGTPVPMYPSYQYQYQYQYNPQYPNGSYSNTPNYNSNNYTRSSANKYNQAQRKNSSSTEVLKCDDDSNNEEIRSVAVKGTPLTKDTNSTESKFSKLNI